MSAVRIELDHLHIAVSGVSSLVVEQAMSSLADELRRQIGASPLAVAGADVPTLHVGPIDVPSRVDAAQLRALIAERVLATIVQAHAGGV
jgi:hypothetical protein